MDSLSPSSNPDERDRVDLCSRKDTLSREMPGETATAVDPDRRILIERIARTREQTRTLEALKDRDAFDASELVPHHCGSDLEDKEHTR